MQLKQPQITEFCKAVASGCSPYNAFVLVVGNDMFAAPEIIQDIAAKLAAEKEVEIATIRKRNILSIIDVTTPTIASIEDVKEFLTKTMLETENYEVVEGKIFAINTRKDRLAAANLLKDIYFREREINKESGTEEEPKTIFKLKKDE